MLVYPNIPSIYSWSSPL